MALEQVSDVDLIVGVSVGVALLGLGLLILRGAADRPYNRTFFVLAWVWGLRTLFEGPLVVARNHWSDQLSFLPPTEQFDTVALSLGVVGASLLLLVAAQFPQPIPLLRRSPWAPLWFAVPPLAFAVAAAIPGLLAASALPWVGQGFILALAVVALLGPSYDLRTARKPVDRERARRTIYAVALVALGEAAALLPATAGAILYAEHILRWIALVMAATLYGYAIVKFQLIGIGFRFRRAVRYGLTLVILASILAASDGWVGEFVLEPMFGFTGYYWLVASLVGVLLFKPVGALSSWLADRVFPDPAKHPEMYKGSRGREIYQAQVANILRDGQITARERAFLETLRSQLELPKTETRRIEAEVRRALGAEGRLASGRRRPVGKG